MVRLRAARLPARSPSGRTSLPQFCRWGPWLSPVQAGELWLWGKDVRKARRAGRRCGASAAVLAGMATYEKLHLRKIFFVYIKDNNY